MKRELEDGSLKKKKTNPCVKLIYYRSLNLKKITKKNIKVKYVHIINHI